MAEQKYSLHEQVLIEAEIVGICGLRGTNEILYDLYLESDGHIVQHSEEEDIVGLSQPRFNGKPIEWIHYDNKPRCSNCAKEVGVVDAAVYNYCPFCGFRVKEKIKPILTIEEGSDART